MRLIKLIFVATSALCLVSAPLYAEPASKHHVKSEAQRQIQGAEGIWLTKQGKSHLKIVECERSLCNEIIWLKQPNDSKGRPHTDKLNKIKKLRGRPIIGLSILTGMKLVGKGHWRGRIYDPERGKSFAVNVKLYGKNKMRVQGCLPLGPPFCQTHIWTKVRDLKPEEVKAAMGEDKGQEI